MQDIANAFYDASNRRSVDAIATLIGHGTYRDPLCGAALTGAPLAAHFRYFFDAFSELRMEAMKTIVGIDAVASEWTLSGICVGAIDRELKGNGARVTLSGVDVFDLAGEAVRVQRTFDRRAFADALGLQTIVEPYEDGAMTFGYSMRDWLSKEKPAALGMTWIRARDEAEKAAIRGHSRNIVQHFREIPGFIGIVTGFAGLHGFTLTAWESEEALRDGTHKGAHREAMAAFRQGLSGGVFTSVWQPLRLNRLWSRCPNGHPNDGTRADRTCEECGAPLPEPEPYI